MKAGPHQAPLFTSPAQRSMLQRSKSAGKQAARQMGYVPLPATQEGGTGSMGSKLGRNVSPAPDQLSKRPPAVKRTIAPGQVWIKE